MIGLGDLAGKIVDRLVEKSRNGEETAPAPNGSPFSAAAMDFRLYFADGTFLVIGTGSGETIIEIEAPP